MGYSKNEVDFDDGMDLKVDETILASDLGTVMVRRNYEEETIELGLRKGNCPTEDPEISIKLTTLQVKRLIDELDVPVSGDIVED